MPKPQRDMTVPVLCAVAAMLCFGGVPVCLKYLTGYLDAWTVNAVRYSTAALFWLPFVLVLGRRLKSRRTTGASRSIWLVALIPAAPNLLGQVGWAASPYYAEASTIGFVIRTSFIFTVVFGFLFIPAERPLARRGLFYVGLVVGLAGVFAMFAGKLFSAPRALPLGPGAMAATGAAMGLPAGWPAGSTALAVEGALSALARPKTTPVGFALILGTAICWGAYAVSVRRFLGGYPLRLAFGVTSLYTTAGLVALAAVFGKVHQLLVLAPAEWTLLVVSAMLGIAFGHVLYYRAIHGIGPVVTNGITLIGPLFTYLLAALFLGERLSPIQLLGGLAVIAGGYALVRAKAQLRRAESAGPAIPD